MTTRDYVIGLPVVLHVSDDGTVRYWVDLSEADDLWDCDPDHLEAEVDADITRVRAAFDSGTLLPVETPMTSTATPADLALLDALTDAESDHALASDPVYIPTLGIVRDRWSLMGPGVRALLAPDGSTADDITVTLDRLIAELGVDYAIDRLYGA